MGDDGDPRGRFPPSSGDGGELLSAYNQLGACVRNIAANPKVTLNFDGDGRGGDVVVLSGLARVDPEAPTADAGLVRHAL